MAALEVDTLTGRLGGYQDLDGAFPELLLGIEPGTRLVARPRLHAAVDAPHAEPPVLQPFQQVVEGVLELGEDEQLLVRVIEEALLPQYLLRDGSTSLQTPGSLRGTSPFAGESPASAVIFPAHVLGVAGQRDGIQQPL